MNRLGRKNMPIAIFSTDGTKRLGKVFEDVLIDLTVAAPDLPGTVMEFLIEGEVVVTCLATSLLLNLRAITTSAHSTGKRGRRYPAPILFPIAAAV
jgi:hypothetical protein